MGWFKTLFASPAVVADTAKDIRRGIDSLVFTSEEKSEANLKGLEIYLKLQEATSGQNLARRYIAASIVALWIFLVLLMIALKLFGAVLQADFVFKTINDIVNNPFMIVIGFYFLAHLARSNK